MNKVFLPVIAACLLSMGVNANQETQARGVVLSLDQAVLSSELGAKVISIPKRMGEKFKQGEVLIQMDCGIFEAQKQKVAAELKSAEIKLENARQLNQLRSIGTLEVSLAQAEVQKTQAEFQIADLNTQRCEIKAPFTGRVEQVEIQPFEIAQQNQPLIKVVGNTRLETEIVVPADWIKWLKTGQKIRLVTDETQQTLKATLSQIGPVIDTTSQTLVIRAKLNSNTQGVYPGMSVMAYFQR